ncbi:MAG: RrF2 family transcriptional regulator [Armatimonadota bacterium]
MKITAQEEYGLRCLMNLARRVPGQTVNAREISEGEGLSVAYVEKILHQLTRSGLTESVRGASGGYRLKRMNDAITLRQALDALGGVINTMDVCDQFTGSHEVCVHQHAGCGIRSVWGFIGDYLSLVFDSITLRDLVDGNFPMQMEPLRYARESLSLVDTENTVQFVAAPQEAEHK